MSANNPSAHSPIFSDTVYVENILKPYLKDFILERFHDISNMSEALSSKNFDEVKKLAHRIKGSAGSYGFIDLGNCARLLEDLANMEDLQKIQFLSEQMEYHLKTVNIVYVDEKDQ